MSRSDLLSHFAYYRTGGPCAKLIDCSSVEDLRAELKCIGAESLPMFVLGRGSNSLVVDEPWPGAVIVLRSLNFVERTGRQLLIGAGVENSELARFCLQEGLAGLEWMNGLPGEIGGTVRMNARCYGGEISQCVSRVWTLAKDGEIKEYADATMFRGYKDTVFMNNDELIVSVQVSLRDGDADAMAEKMEFCLSDRQSKGQFDYPTCGCVFKNDYSVGVPSGLLLQEAGAKQLVFDRLQVNPHHANFLYNKGASSREILEATFKMRELVYDRFGVWLDYEMEVLGALSDDLKKRFAEKRKRNGRCEAEIRRLRADFASR